MAAFEDAGQKMRRCLKARDTLLWRPGLAQFGGFGEEIGINNGRH